MKVLNLSNKITRKTWISRWPQWVGYGAAIWSFLYLFLGIYWILGGSGFPFGENDIRGEIMGSPLYSLKTNAGAATVAVTGLVGGIASLAMVRLWWRQIPSVVFISFAWLMSVLLILVIPDTRLVQIFAYLFILNVDLVDWPLINQVLCLAGGLLWGATALAYQRHVNEACGHCGRMNLSQESAVESAYRGGKIATMIAVFMALPYGIVRWAWSVGVPLGASEATMLANASFEGRVVEFILGGLHIGGAILSLALIQKWGVIFPRWCLFVSGKRIPIWLVVVPAIFASAIITIAGLKTSIQLIIGLINGSVIMDSTNWGELGPAFFWLPWGVSVGFATLFYYLRRRGSCTYCGKL